MKKTIAVLTLALFAALSATAADPAIERYVKHLEISRDFTIKVAEQMPAADYGYKLTPPQMSFAEQLTHIGNANAHFLSLIAGEKAPDDKPASMNKADVMAFVKRADDYAVSVLQKATPEQLDKTYKTPDGSMTGWEVLMLVLDHSTHHRAQCEMYLRSKGITPTQYLF